MKRIGVSLIVFLGHEAIKTDSVFTLFGEMDYLLLWTLVIGIWITGYLYFSENNMLDRIVKKLTQILKNVNKSRARIIDFVLAFIVMVVIPITGYYTINSIVSLPTTLYIVSSLSGFYVICFLAMIEIHRNLSRIYWKLINYLIFIFVIPVLAFYLFDLITPINLSSQHFGEAGFSYIFSAGVAAGFELLRPKRNI